MLIIKNNEILRRYVPNVLRDVAGESNLFDKAFPALASAEEWVSDEIAGSAVMNGLSESDESDRTFVKVARLIACTAMAEVVPMLDLILTPNGFGVVSNSNIAPASKERVDRLITALESQWERLAAELLSVLRSVELWHKSSQFAKWSKLMLSPLDLREYVSRSATPMTYYTERRAEMVAIEAAIEREFLGAEYLQFLREACWSDNVEPDDLHVANDVVDAVASSLRAVCPRLENLVSTVNIIRNNPDVYTLWHATMISQVYSHEPFKNDKNNHGYFL